MSLMEMVKELGELSNEDFAELKRQVKNEERERAARELEKMPTEEWIARMEAAAAEIREGFTDEEWAQVEHDMNVEYIEPVDEAEWRD